MRVLLTGAGGQLGKELQDTAPSGIELTAASRLDCDISQAAEVERIIEQSAPELIINAAAYTAVDKAEQEQTEAYAINRTGIENIATAAKQTGAKIIHISTDFVFDGQKNQPYRPNDDTSPQSVYGASKLAGEQALQALYPNRHILIRTSWVYSKYGNNFVKTMLRLMQERDQLGVVSDQIGAPTWAQGLAKVIWAFAEQPDTYGSYHWSDNGVASWYDFAVAIQRQGLAVGLLNQPITINPITTADYPTPATRPAYSVMDCKLTKDTLNINGDHWQSALQAMMNGLIDP